jgi:hypothetical protein
MAETFTYPLARTCPYHPPVEELPLSPAVAMQGVESLPVTW